MWYRIPGSVLGFFPPMPAAVPKHGDKDVFKHCQMSSGAQLHPVKKALSWMEKYYHQLIFVRLLMVCGTVPTAHLLPGSSHGGPAEQRGLLDGFTLGVHS